MSSVSMDGFRRNASIDLRELRDIVAAVVNGEYYDAEILRETMNEVISNGNVLNCIYSEDEDNFSDLSEDESMQVAFIGDE